MANPPRPEIRKVSSTISFYKSWRALSWPRLAWVGGLIHAFACPTRRFTRLMNAFSKKWENYWAALCLYFAYYTFCRIHGMIRVTPPMEMKIADRVWNLAELLA